MALEVVESGTETIISLVAAVIDESGSMSGVTVETINGYNTFVADVQAEQAGKEAYVSTFLFDLGHTYSDGQAVMRPLVRTIQDAVPLAQAVPLTTDTYRPNGSTPLYDAIGIAIRSIDESCKTKGINKVTLIIQTDGAENASKEFSHKAVTDLIKDRQDKGWQIVFMGADLANAHNIGVNLGVMASNSMGYSKGKTKEAFSAMSASTVAYRSSMNASLETTLSAAEKQSLLDDQNLGIGTPNLSVGNPMWTTTTTTTVTPPIGATKSNKKS